MKETFIFSCSHDFCKYFDSENPLNGTKESGCIQLEQEVLSPLAGTNRAFVMTTNNWWSQLKSAGSAIYANRHYLELYRSHHPQRLAQNQEATVIGDVYIHQSASVHPTSVVSCVDQWNCSIILSFFLSRHV